jgi:ATP/maltotriose-dependent transcriptional regulator MalT
LAQRYVDTCRWIYDNADFKSWQDHQYLHLWVCGKPGSGKSVLAASIIEYLRLENITAYFFCKLADDNQNTLESIMRTWLWQLLERMPQFSEFALANYLKGIGIYSQVELVKDTLRRIISQCENVIYLVLDGLDECQLGAASADRLMDFAVTLGPNARLVIVSRPENWIQKAINARLKGRYCTIKVTSTATENDISRWIHNCVLTMELHDPELEQLAI